MKNSSSCCPAKSGLAGFVLLGLLLGPSVSLGIALDTVDWAASSTNNGMGTGQLDGITVSYQSAPGFNSGNTDPEDWPSYQGTDAATAVTFQTGGVLGGGTAPGTTETISFSAEVSNPVLLVNFLGGLGHTFDGDSFDFGANSFTVLSAFNATQTGNTMAATTSVTDSADDGYAIQFNGTFGPSNPLSFTYTSNGMGQDGLQSVAFTIGIPSPTATFANISTRLNVVTGDNVLIGGFIITGTDSKQVVLRAIGPSLAVSGVSGVLADPTLSLHDSTGAVIASNDNWMENSTADQTVLMNEGLAPTDPAESALVQTLDPGSYTAIVSGVGGTTGVALVEAYDIDAAAASELANISTRGLVGTGDDVMIGGFIIVGGSGASNTIVVRGIGPSLTAKGVVGALQDPNLELHDGNGATIASNDNWMDSPDMQEIIDDGLAPTDDKESAVLAVLVPGAYTAILSGVNGTTGVALVEAYNLH